MSSVSWPLGTWRLRVCVAVFGFVGLVPTLSSAVLPGQPLTYTGQIFDHDAPAQGSYPIHLSLWASAGATDGPACETAAGDTVEVTDGWFSVSLPAACVTAVLEHPKLWVELAVDGEVVGPRTQLTAVPWALQSGTTVATRAGTAGGQVVTGTISMVRYELASFDSHNATSDVAGWRFVAPHRGTYRLEASLSLMRSLSDWSGDEIRRLLLFVNGVETAIIDEDRGDSGPVSHLQGSDLLLLEAGDVVEIGVYALVSVVTTVQAEGSHVACVQVGN